MQDATGLIPREYSLSPLDQIDGDTDDLVSSEASVRWARYCAHARTLDRDELLDTVLDELKESPELLSHLDDACLSPYPEPERPRAHVGETATLGLAVLQTIVTAIDNAVGIRMAVEALHAGEED